MPSEASAGPLSDLLYSCALPPDPTGIHPALPALFPGCLLIAVFLLAQSGPGGTGHPHAAEKRERAPGSSTPRTEQVLSLLLIAAVLLATATTVYIVVNPQEGERFTEFYILGPTGKAANYPTEFMAGTPQTVIIGIGNHESRDITYTVQTFAVKSRFNGATNKSVIVSATPLDRFSVTVPNNRTVEQPYTFRIMDSDVDRLEFLLFMEAPQAEIPVANLTRAGYRNLHLLLRVH
ncbi:DUF1616 domain-containing protein [Methanoculleus sp. Wushi-C6]|uniref:DUF1616 domain-containing protein n=1 Tax=Methanoculleus caldifontis TaxID=2651577 RepID=A0ABU3X226_9EURY|nr:DUF1616 domain-containing protein [Methanoculleus sp. Wushi-C6]MDV2482110.1 DUF1616 domain-containing protein [Methanoculleus sp. Wushi-C6]